MENRQTKKATDRNAQVREHFRTRGVEIVSEPEEDAIRAIKRLISADCDEGLSPAQTLESYFGGKRYIHYHKWRPGKEGAIAMPGRVNCANIEKMVVVILSDQPKKYSYYYDKIRTYYEKEAGKKLAYENIYHELASYKTPRLEVYLLSDKPMTRKSAGGATNPKGAAFPMRPYNPELWDMLHPPDSQCKEEKTSSIQVQMLSPKQIYARLDEKVYGQEAAKKSLAVVLYQHLMRFMTRNASKPLSKTNTLLVGPTGCGKTLAAKAMAEITGLPFLRLDATIFVQRGLRGGMHAEQIVDLLLNAAKGNIELAKHGIIFLDEVDKLRKEGFNEYGPATVGVQQELLAMIDGAEVAYEPDHDEYERKIFNFGQVLFLFGGAFNDLNGDVYINDLVKYGFTPEFAGRLGNVIRMEPLPEEVLRRIIRREIQEYKAYLPINDDQAGVYTELIAAGIMADGLHIKYGARCVAPQVRRFFEDRIFETK